MTLKTANLYYQLLSDGNENVQLLSLQHKAVWVRGHEMLEIEKEYLIPAQKFVIVMPEYNGSFPGILKLMMDNSDIKKSWWYKKAMLVGLSDGRSGNLRGLEHMTAILHYMKVNVLYNKLQLARINEEIGIDGKLLKPAMEQRMNEQITDFLKF